MNKKKNLQWSHGSWHSITPWHKRPSTWLFSLFRFFFWCPKCRHYVAMFHKYNGKKLSPIASGEAVFMVFWAPDQVFSVTYRHIVADFSTFTHLHSCKLTQGKIFIKVSRITETSIECYGRNKIISNSECGCAIASWSMLQWHCIFMVNEQIVDVIFVDSTDTKIYARKS